MKWLRIFEFPQYLDAYIFWGKCTLHSQLIRSFEVLIPYTCPFPKNIKHPKKFYVCSNSKIRKFEDGFSKFWKFEKRSSKFWNIRKIGRGQMNGAYVLYVLEISLVIRIMHLSSKILFDITFLSTCNRNKKHKCWLRYFLFMTLGYLITYERETKSKALQVFITLNYRLFFFNGIDDFPQ